MGAVDDGDVHIGVLLGERGHGLVQFQAAVVAQVPDAQRRCAARGHAGHVLPQLAGLFQNRTRVGVEIFARRCQREAPVFPVEQLNAQLGLQRTDLLGDRGLGNVALFRGFGKAVAVHHRHEIAHLT